MSISDVKRNGSRFGELKSRLLFVIFSILIFRLGVYIPIPYINIDHLQYIISDHNFGNKDLLAMFNIFSGGALEKLSIFALGVMPYISSSIVFQMLTAIMPSLIELKKDGEIGQNRITQYTRYFACTLALFQSLGIVIYIFNQPNLVNIDSKYLFYLFGMSALTAGSMFLMWLGEQITERGIGNGISLIIFSGIVANIPFEFKLLFNNVNTGLISYISFWFLLVVIIFLILFIVFIEGAQRKILVHYAKRQHGRRIYSQQSSYLPLKLNMAGVVPAIFASSILMVPGIFLNWIASVTDIRFLIILNDIFQPGTFIYTIIFFTTIMFFCFFYTALVFNPKETADNLKKSGAFISGVRPGIKTAEYIDKIMSKLTFIGAIYISFICLMPIFIVNLLGSTLLFSFGGTSLLIIIVVIIDFITQIKSYMISSRYDTLL